MKKTLSSVIRRRIIEMRWEDELGWLRACLTTISALPSLSSHDSLNLYWHKVANWELHFIAGFSELYLRYRILLCIAFFICQVIYTANMHLWLLLNGSTPCLMSSVISFMVLWRLSWLSRAIININLRHPVSALFVSSVHAEVNIRDSSQ